MFTVYKSTDGSAPVLSGTAGALITLLDAVLVNGYGAKAGAGWTKAFSGTNKAAYRPGSGTRFYLRILDDGSLTGGARDANLRGYESMSDVDTGTNPFPTVAQLSDTNMCVRKSTSADSTARPWVIFADSRTFYMFVQTGDSTTTYILWAFGDFYSKVDGDAYNCFIIGSNASNASALTGASTTADVISTNGAGQTRHYVARRAAGTGGSEQFSKMSSSLALGSVAFAGTLAYPSPVNGNLEHCSLWLMDTSSPAARGRFRGLHCPLHAISNFADADPFSADPDTESSGETYYILKQTINAGAPILVTSDTLETN